MMGSEKRGRSGRVSVSRTRWLGSRDWRFLNTKLVILAPTLGIRVDPTTTAIRCFGGVSYRALERLSLASVLTYHGVRGYFSAQLWRWYRSTFYALEEALIYMLIVIRIDLLCSLILLLTSLESEDGHGFIHDTIALGNHSTSASCIESQNRR